MKPHTQKFLQQRRFYMVLPVLALPFITMIFWALGGGQGTTVQAKEIQGTGLNLSLPGAHFDKEDELWDKFSLYEQAKRDSLKYEEARRNDPYYEVATLKVNVQQDSVPKPGSKLNTSLGSKDKYEQIDKNEKMINRKLEQLTRQLSQPEKPVAVSQPTRSNVIEQKVEPADPQMSQDVERLEKMMEIMASGEPNDPEMQQIEGMLDKILDIQHPDRVKERIKAQSLEHKQNVFPIVAAREEDNISLVESAVSKRNVYPNDSLESMYRTSIARNSFYGLDDEISEGEQASNAIEAVIHDTQTVVAGSTVKMRLLSDLYINGQLIKKDEFVYGVCSINGERLTIAINSIRNEKSLFPVSMSVFDLDGMEGIYIPGAITRDAAKQASSQSIQDIQLYSMDNSLGVQAATAGIEAAKGLFSKKAKLIKVTLKAGYQILLQDTDQQNL